MKKRMIAALLLSALTITGAASHAVFAADPIIVGSKDFTESAIVAEIYCLALENAGIPIERNLQIGSQIIHQAITGGDIDMYPEYTGTALVTWLGEEPIYDSDECYEFVKKAYKEKFNLTFLDNSTVNDSEGLAARKDVAEEYGLKTISDVWANASKLSLCGNGEFFEAVATYPRLMEIYGHVEFKEEVTMDHTLSFTACKNGDVDVISVYTTEGSLAGDDFVILEDDKKCWPPYYLCPIISDEKLAEYPEAADVINAVTATFTYENIIGMCAAVDIDGEDFEDVAEDYFESIKDSL